MTDPHVLAPGLARDCSRCFGLCCVGLPFARSADFPEHKAAGVPCRNLAVDHRCSIHAQLRDLGWKGCTVYDCFGAGQYVAQVLFEGVSWREAPETAEQMFAALPVVHQLHEMLALLTEAAQLASGSALAAGVRACRDEVLAQRDLGCDALLALDLGTLRQRVGPVLSGVSRHVRGAVRLRDHVPAPDRRLRPGADLVGADLRGNDLRTADLRGALLIAADLRDSDLRHTDVLGADLRDADLRGARLDDVIYLTRPQLAAARR